MKPSLPLIALSLLSCSPSSGGSPDIATSDAWARAAAPGKTVTAAYLTISNRGSADDALVSITSSSGSAEVHSTSMDNGIMRMRKLDRLPLPAGETVKLEPGGTHLMLTELREPLMAGETIDLGMRFEKSGEHKVAAQVRDSSGGRH